MPVIRSLNIEFKKPAMTDIITEAYFSEQDAEKMNTAMESDGRYDFELKINIKNASGEIVSEVKGSYAIRLMG